MQNSAQGALHKIPRRAHRKSKTGCRTCKVRKVKCDERRPLCANCERHYTNLVTCDFDDQEPVLVPGSSTTVGLSNRGTALSASQASAALVHMQSPQFQLGTGRLDPFEARPSSTEASESVDRLLNHYLIDFAFRSFPFNANKQLIELWWDFVRKDEVLFHVVLFLSEQDRERLQAKSDSIRSRALLDQCLVLLRNRIQNPTSYMSDQTMVAIAKLAAMEHDRGNMRALEMHLKGLRQMVELRGGLDVIREGNPMVANLIFWYAMVSIDLSHVIPLEYKGACHGFKSLGWFPCSEETRLTMQDGSRIYYEDLGFDKRTASMLYEAQGLSARYVVGSPDECVTILSLLCWVAHRLLKFSKVSSDDSPTPGLAQSCRLAGCLHLFVPNSGIFPDPTLMLSTLVRDLKLALSVMIPAVGTQYPLLLWLLSVGAVAAKSMPERTWFVGHLTVVMTDLRIESWEMMQPHLLSFAFYNKLFAQGFKDLWNAVAEKQEILNLTPTLSRKTIISPMMNFGLSPSMDLDLSPLAIKV